MSLVFRSYVQDMVQGYDACAHVFTAIFLISLQSLAPTRGFPVSFGRLFGRVIGLSGRTSCRLILGALPLRCTSLQYLAPTSRSGHLPVTFLGQSFDWILESYSYTEYASQP